MPTEHDLKKLLSSMQPELHPDVFVFCTLPINQKIPENIKPLSQFQETEGTAIIVRRYEAEKAGVAFQFPSRMIMLKVYSALDAVGFLAAITTCLAKAGISVNPISAYHHDHLFVPEHRAEEVMKLLFELTQT